MRHAILLYVAMTFGALSYCLALLVSKDAPAQLVLAAGITGLAILTGVSWLVWQSQQEEKNISGPSACSACSLTISNEDAAGASCGPVSQKGE